MCLTTGDIISSASFRDYSYGHIVERMARYFLINLLMEWGI